MAQVRTLLGETTCFNGMANFSSARGKAFGVTGYGACALAGPALQALDLAPGF